MLQPKTLIVGASGQVGTQMLGVLGERALATSREPRQGWLALDMAEFAETAQAAALLDAHELEAIYCVGGMTWVDGCESQPDMAWRTNARGPGVLASYASQRGLPYVFFSTDYVFDGSEEHPGPYTEEAEPQPLSVYGRTKLEGEQRVQHAHHQALILRTTWVYGPDPRQKNFVYSLMSSLMAGRTLQVPMDQVSTPTYNRDLIHAAMGLVEAQATGLFHLAGPESMDRLSFAQQIAKTVGLGTSLLEGASTAKLAQPAARPLHSGLATGKLVKQYPQLRMRTLTESLADCGAELREFLPQQARASSL